MSGRKKSKGPNMKVFGEYRVWDILPDIGTHTRYFDIEDEIYDVHMTSVRLLCFKRTLVCAECKIIGSRFILETHNADWERSKNISERIISGRSRYGACYVEDCQRCRVFYSGRVRPHLNLYARRDGELILMTKDHIIPRSRGGGNDLNNLQTMCAECNHAKGSVMPEDHLHT